MIYTNNNVIYINLNYNKDFLILGLIDGYEIYKIEPFELKIRNKLNKSIGIIDILENTNIIIFTGGNENGYCNKNELILYDDNDKKELHKVKCESNILNLKITEKYILVVLVDKIIIYNINNLSIINFIETGSNIHGLISINYNNNNLLNIASVGKIKGNILVCNDSLFSKREINAHINYINYLCYNKRGNLLATSSTKGTIIRIFNVNNNYEKIKELRRGSSHTRILNMNFNDDSNILICSTINGSVHLFNTGLNNELNHLENKKIKYFSNILDNIPDNYISKYIKSEWGFTKYHNDNLIFILILIINNNIYAIGNNGKYYKLKINNNGKIEIINILFFTEKHISPFNIIKNNS